MIRAKNEGFINEIRRKQRTKIFDDCRKKLMNNFPPEECAGVIVWRDYILNPTPNIPSEVVRNFDSIAFFEDDLEMVVNEHLDAGNLLNMIFVIKCVKHHKTEAKSFFEKSLSNESIHESSFEQIALFTNHQNCYNIQIEFWSLCTQNITEISFSDVTAINGKFIKIWNTQSHLNLGICAELMHSLIKYSKQEFLANAKLIAHALIAEDRSKSTYKFVKDLAVCALPAMFEIVMHPKFQEFVVDGIREQTVREVLLIFGHLFQNTQISKNIALNFSVIVAKMSELYLSVDDGTIQNIILLGLYNMAWLQLPNISQLFQVLPYERLYSKTKSSNALDFFDFCIAVLINYPTEATFKQIVEGKQLRIVALSQQNALLQHGQYLSDLMDAMLIGANAGIQVGVICSQLQPLYEKLLQAQWEWKWDKSNVQKQNCVKKCEQILSKLSN